MYILNLISDKLKFIKYLLKIIKFNSGTLGASISVHYRIFTRWKKQIENKQSPIDLHLPWISFMAMMYLESYINSHSENSLNVFEFGSGGSTLYFCKRTKRLISVEHDSKWHFLISEKIKDSNCSNCKLLYIAPQKIDDKKKRSAAKPSDFYTGVEQYKKYYFENYVKSIDIYENSYFDIILIDGRSRVSCIDHAISKLKIGGLLILDNAERPRYFEQNIINENNFRLKINHYGALIGSPNFVKTNIYEKI